VPDLPCVHGASVVNEAAVRSSSRSRSPPHERVGSYHSYGHATFHKATHLAVFPLPFPSQARCQTFFRRPGLRSRHSINGIDQGGEILALLMASLLVLTLLFLLLTREAFCGILVSVREWLSVFVIRMSKMHSRPCFQNPRTPLSPSKSVSNVAAAAPSAAPPLLLLLLFAPAPPPPLLWWKIGAKAGVALPPLVP